MNKHESMGPFALKPEIKKNKQKTKKKRSVKKWCKSESQLADCLTKGTANTSKLLNVP